MTPRSDEAATVRGPGSGGHSLRRHEHEEVAGRSNYKVFSNDFANCPTNKQIPSALVILPCRPVNSSIYGYLDGSMQKNH